MATQASVRGLFIDMATIIAATVVIRNVMGLPFVRGVVSRGVGSVGQGAVALAVGAAAGRRREAYAIMQPTALARGSWLAWPSPVQLRMIMNGRKPPFL